VRFAIFKDRNFLIGCFFMVIMGLMLFSSMALSAPFIQNVLGYPIETTGWLLASRGLGTLFGMAMIGRPAAAVRGALPDPGRAYPHGQHDVPDDRLHRRHVRAAPIVICGLVQGLGMGLVFIPLSTGRVPDARAALPHRRHRDADSGT
jgi:DHA2 family multidrug resistance protein